MIFANKEKFERSSTYRSDYLKSHQGLHGYYICAYCGKIMKQKKMQVDHIVSVKGSQTRLFSHLAVRKKGVNAEENLTSSCRRCNDRKGKKGGFWVLMGHIGIPVQILLWLAFIVFLVLFTRWFFASGFYIDIVRNIKNSAIFK